MMLIRNSIVLAVFFHLTGTATAGSTIARVGGPALDLLAGHLGSGVEWLDRQTSDSKPTVLDVPKSPTLEKIALVVTYRVAGIGAEKTVSNTVFGRQVPGSAITARIKVDCLIYCAFDADQLRIETDPDYPDTIKVVLPACEVRAEFPPNEDADYEVDYGRLRGAWLNGERARTIRRDLYGDALRLAHEKFSEEQLGELRADVAERLERLLRERFPGKRIYVVK